MAEKNMVENSLYPIFSLHLAGVSTILGNIILYNNWDFYYAFLMGHRWPLFVYFYLFKQTNIIGPVLTELGIDQMAFCQPSLKSFQFCSAEGKIPEQFWSIVIFMED